MQTYPNRKIYIIENDQPNAFATGRNPENAAVAATTGLLKILNEKEVGGRYGPRTGPCEKS